jgi:hypothetical protein
MCSECYVYIYMVELLTGWYSPNRPSFLALK